MSSTTFLSCKIDDHQTKQYTVDKPLLLSSISNNKFSIPGFLKQDIEIASKNIRIEYVDFFQDPVDQILENQKNGYNILELIVPAKSGGKQSEYLTQNSTKKINNIVIAFDSSMESDFSISQLDSIFYFRSGYDVEYMKMSDQSKGVLKQHDKHILNHKTLYTVNGRNINILTVGAHK